MNLPQTTASLSKRRIEGFASGVYKIAVCLMLVGFASFIVMLVFASTGGIPFYASIATMIGSLALAKGLEVYKYRTFRCPECQRRLPPPSTVEGETIKFTCADCSIEWDTGRKVAESSA